MTAPIGLPFTTRFEYSTIGTDPVVLGVSIRRPRFPREIPFRSWTLQYGPTTFADLDATILSVIRAAKGGASIVTLTVPDDGAVRGRFGPVKWVNRSPTNATFTVTFEQIPSLV